MELEAYIGKSVEVGVFTPEDDTPTDVLVIVETNAAHPTVISLAPGAALELSEELQKYAGDIQSDKGFFGWFRKRKRKLRKQGSVAFIRGGES